MRIEINTTNTKKAIKLLTKFLNMNENSDYNYLDNDSLIIGYNKDSGFTYIYLEDNPSVSLCLDNSNDLCIVYNSGLDGIEFIKYTIPSTLDKLETLFNNVYTLEDDIRGDDYENDEATQKFINTMIKKKWDEL